MKILFLAPRLPVPADTGGKIRTFQILRQLAKTAEVDLLCFFFEPNDDVHAKRLEELGIKVHGIKASRADFTRQLPLIIFRSWPVAVAKYHSSIMSRKLADLLKNQKFDFIHCDHIHMAQYRGYFGEIPCLVDEHNVEYKISGRCAAVEKNKLIRKLYEDQAGRMRRFEARTIEKFSVCTAVSENDKDILDELVNKQTPVEVVPNGVDTQFFIDGHHDEEEEDAVVFTGSMDWLPNEDAVEFFVKDIWPHIRLFKPQARLYVVGKNPSRRVLKMAQEHKQLTVTGVVDDVRPFMTKAKVFVVPLRIGGGTRLKILEAMSMQKAVVSTSLGAEGIHYSHDNDIVIADHEKQFAREVLDLMDNQPRRSKIGLAGRHLVTTLYDWDSIGQKLKGTYEKFITQR